MAARKRKERAYGIGPAAGSPVAAIDAYFQLFGDSAIAAATYTADGAYIADRGTPAPFEPITPRTFAVYSATLAGPAIGWLPLRLDFDTAEEVAPNGLRIWSPSDGAEGEVFAYDLDGWVLHGGGYDPAGDHTWWIEREAAANQIGAGWFTRFRLRRSGPKFGGVTATMREVNLPHPGGAYATFSAWEAWVGTGGFQLGASAARFDHRCYTSGTEPHDFAIVFPLAGDLPSSSFDDDTFGAVSGLYYFGTPGIGATVGRLSEPADLYRLALDVDGAPTPHLESVIGWNVYAADQIAYWTGTGQVLAGGALGLDVIETITVEDHPVYGQPSFVFRRPT
ncbi:MAG TPA: hypothetical protein VGS22_16465 [Thermoanaerobaculia bacterium]|jgi:hypothetical protein|nr:hypothetical protein [Thermoanaerobaculia bacterium]